MATAKITRKEAAELASEQLHYRYDKVPLPNKKNPPPHEHHYGRCELRALLDAIYGPPADESEYVR